MPFGDWVVGVFLRFNTDGSVVMGRLSRETRAANEQLLRQQGLIDANTAALLRYQRQMQSIQDRRFQLGTKAAGVIAIGAIGSAIYAVKQAADLQTALMSIKIGTGANDAQLEAIRRKAYEISNITAQSVAQSARVMAVMASAGINNPKQLLQIAKPAALYADVQYLKSGGSVSFEDAARQAIQVAHLYQAYTPRQIAPILDRLTKLSFMMPDNVSRYLTQASYYVPLFRRIGVPDEQTEVLGAFLDRMGYGRGKGGTSAQNLLLRSLRTLQITGHVQGGSRDALERFGLIGPDGSPRFAHTDAKGKTTYDLFGELEQINKAIAEQTKGLKGQSLTAARMRAITDIMNAFGAQGGRLGLLGTPTGMGQLLGMVHQMRTMPGMEAAQGIYMNTTAGQFTRAVSNFKSVMTELGTPWLDDLTGLFRGIGDSLHGTQAWLHQHKDIDHDIGAVVAILGFLGTVGFLAGSIRTVGSVGQAITGLARLGSAPAGAAAVESIGARVASADVVGGGAAWTAELGLEGLAAALLSPVGAVAAVAALGYGAVELARNYRPLNNSINRTVTSLQNMPGPLHNLGVTLAAFARDLGISHTGNPLAIKDKKGHYIGFAGTHASMHADDGFNWGWFWTDYWKTIGNQSLAALHKAAPPTAPQSFLDEMSGGMFGMLGRWLNSFIQSTPSIVTPSESAALQAKYDKLNAAGRNMKAPAVHVHGDIHVHTHGTTHHQAKQVAQHLMNLTGTIKSSASTPDAFPASA